MNLTQVKGNTWVLEGSGLMGLYRLEGDRCILLDSGEDFEREELAHTLAQAGLAPVGVLSTHIHTDHSINNGWLRREYGCQVAAPAGEVHLAKSPRALKGYLYSYTPEELTRIRGEMACPVDCPIPEEDGTFTFCGVPFSILHTPGHSLDHLCAVTPDNVCMVGDAVLTGEESSFKLPYALFLDQMIYSAGLLLNSRCDAYILSHRGVVSDIDPAVEWTQALLRKRAEEIRSLVDRPMTWEEVWRAVNEHFCLLSSRVFRAAVMERNLRSFLDYLVDQGKLERSARRGMIYLSPVK